MNGQNQTFLDVRAQLGLALELGAARVAVVDSVQRVVSHVHAQLVVELELLAALRAVVLVRAVLAPIMLPEDDHKTLLLFKQQYRLQRDSYLSSTSF